MQVGDKVVYTANRKAYPATVCTAKEVREAWKEVRTSVAYWHSETPSGYVPLRLLEIDHGSYHWFCPLDSVTYTTARVEGNTLILD